MNENLRSVTAFAPATVANVAVGFDILGFALDGVSDTVTLIKTSNSCLVEIDKIEGIPGIPFDVLKNSATIGLLQMLKDFKLDFGFKVIIEKKIPLSSGMGGSAASSVAAVLAASAFMPRPLSTNELIHYALLGESAVSNGIFADNIAPALYGGLTLIRSTDPIDIINLPVPDLFCVLIHPDIKIETKSARGLLKPEITLAQHVKQSAHLASFVAGCFKDDLDLIKKSCQDFIIENQRAHLLPGFYDIQKAALLNGALASSFSGSGPSMFALVKNEIIAEVVADAMKKSFIAHGISNLNSWISPINKIGAKIIKMETE